MNTLKFSATRNTPSTDYIVDLKSRKETISIEDKYTFGNDGAKVWITPARDSFPSKNPRFMKNLLFYFVAVPFVFADEGVTVADLGSKEIDGRKYDVIKATFGAGIGDAPEDQYIMYVNPNSHVVGYKWENETLGEKRYESPFANVSFSAEKMGDDFFKVPEGAWVE